MGKGHIEVDESGKPVIGGGAKEVDDGFRNYDDSDRQASVERHYRMMRENQTLEYVLRMKEKFAPLDNAEMDIWEAFEALDTFVDASDPDTELPNIVHMLQTAESMRAAGEPEWMQLTGLIHDLGKLAYRFSSGAADGMDGNGGDQWGLAGDTFIVGCRLPDCLVFSEHNELNPDMKHPDRSTELGVYEPNCGLANVHCAFGHDEYLWMVLSNHDQCTLPKEALDMVRFHSLYPWHHGAAYKHLMGPGDEEMLEQVRRFQQYDLYTKHGDKVDVDELKPYYSKLIDKYVPGKLRW